MKSYTNIHVYIKQIKKKLACEKTIYRNWIYNNNFIKINKLILIIQIEHIALKMKLIYGIVEYLTKYKTVYSYILHAVRLK